MNPQTTMKNDTVNTITTTPTTDTTIKSLTTVDSKDDIVIDDHLLGCKNQCSNLVLFEAGMFYFVCIFFNLERVSIVVFGIHMLQFLSLFIEKDDNSAILLKKVVD